MESWIIFCTENVDALCWSGALLVRHLLRLGICQISGYTCSIQSQLEHWRKIQVFDIPECGNILFHNSLYPTGTENPGESL